MRKILSILLILTLIISACPLNIYAEELQQGVDSVYVGEDTNENKNAEQKDATNNNDEQNADDESSGYVAPADKPAAKIEAGTDENLSVSGKNNEEIINANVSDSDKDENRQKDIDEPNGSRDLESGDIDNNKSVPGQEKDDSNNSNVPSNGTTGDIVDDKDQNNVKDEVKDSKPENIINNPELGNKNSDLTTPGDVKIPDKVQNPEEIIEEPIKEPDKVQAVEEVDRNYSVSTPTVITPGEVSKIVISGTWSSHELAKVNVVDSVVLTSVDDGSTITIPVYFNGLEVFGQDDEYIEIEQEIRLGEWDGPLFGEWTGAIQYSVDFISDGIELLPADGIYEVDKDVAIITPDEIKNEEGIIDNGNIIDVPNEDVDNIDVPKANDAVDSVDTVKIPDIPDIPDVSDADNVKSPESSEVGIPNKIPDIFDEDKNSDVKDDVGNDIVKDDDKQSEDKPDASDTSINVSPNDEVQNNTGPDIRDNSNKDIQDVIDNPSMDDEPETEDNGVEPETEFEPNGIVQKLADII